MHDFRRTLDAGVVSSRQLNANKEEFFVGEATDSTAGKEVIPSFFYDVISFIIPGSCFIASSIFVWHPKEMSELLYHSIAAVPSKEGSIFPESVIVGILFILFLGISSLVGFFLSSLSYQLVEKMIWKKRCPYTYGGLNEFMGTASKNKKLDANFNRKFGQHLAEVNIDKASVLCTYYIWGKSLALGTITQRLDAEKILSQSSVFISLFLFAEQLIHFVVIDNMKSTGQVWIIFFLIVLCGLASSFSFNFHRKKRIYGRIQIFHALVSQEDGTKSQSESQQAEV